MCCDADESTHSMIMHNICIYYYIDIDFSKTPVELRRVVHLQHAKSITNVTADIYMFCDTYLSAKDVRNMLMSI